MCLSSPTEKAGPRLHGMCFRRGKTQPFYLALQLRPVAHQEEMLLLPWESEPAQGAEIQSGSSDEEISPILDNIMALVAIKKHAFG